MTPEEYLSIPPLPSRFGALIALPRRIAYKLVRPHFAAIMERNLELEEQFIALKKDLLATNHRITWLESLVEAQSQNSAADAGSTTTS